MPGEGATVMGKTAKSIVSNNEQDTDMSGIVQLLAYATEEAERLSLTETAGLISLSIASLREEIQRVHSEKDEKRGNTDPSRHQSPHR